MSSGVTTIGAWGYRPRRHRVAATDKHVQSRWTPGPGAASPSPAAQDWELFTGTDRLHGTLSQVAHPLGLVVFAQGDHGGSNGSRIHFVADVLHDYGFATLLVDLLTAGDVARRRNDYEVARMGERLCAAVSWLRADDGLATLRVGLLGTGIGSAAALNVAADHPSWVDAAVSRGGRPDLAAPRLGQVQAPTLFIVGGRDREVLRLNRNAQQRMHCATRLEVVPGATHQFEEPGALETVAHLAGSWFASHLRGAVRL